MGRKSNSGGVKAKNDGIQFDFKVQGVRCRPTLELEPNTVNLTYARKSHAKILEQIRNGLFNMADWFPRYVPAFLAASGEAPLQPKTFNQYADLYLDAVAGLGASHKTPIGARCITGAIGSVTSALIRFFTVMSRHALARTRGALRRPATTS